MAEKRLMTVTGVGKAELDADMIVISIDVETTDKDYSEATKHQKEKIAELTAALVWVGFEEKQLTTASYGVDTRYENVQTGTGVWKKDFVGYCCSQNLNLKFPHDGAKLSKAITAITSCQKANPSFTVNFTVKDKDKAADKLLEAAIKDAVRKAKVMSKAASLAMGEIQEISYNPQETDFVSPTRFNAHKALCRGADSGDEAVGINPEKIKSSLNVTLTWEIG